jgi:hypothetical protein
MVVGCWQEEMPHERLLKRKRRSRGGWPTRSNGDGNGGCAMTTGALVRVDL